MTKHLIYIIYRRESHSTERRGEKVDEKKDNGLLALEKIEFYPGRLFDIMSMVSSTAIAESALPLKDYLVFSLYFWDFKSLK